MKKIVLSVFALFLAVGLSAQIHLGIKGGLNFNDIKDIQVSSKSVSWNSTGWHAGVLLQAKLPLGFAIQPELMYSVKNISGEGDKADLGYIELPVNVQWGVDLMIFRPFILAAPYVSYLVSKGGDVKDWDGINNFDYGLGLGAGIEIWKFQIVGKYNWGFGKLGDIQTDTWKINDSTLKGFQLSLGFLF